MKKYLMKVGFALLGAFMAYSPAAAQQMPPIPVDQNVRIGKLDNGLTYYIRHNEYPKGQADFYIAQKVGSMQEDDNQRGLAHFLEHMCFNGTKNFPGNEIVSWLETVGVKFGRNLNAYTAFDETVYNISQVPTERESVQDSCLLILHDWADALLLEDEEIDKERGVIHEEWRSRNVGQQRIIEQLFPVIFEGSKYGNRLPIGTMEIVDNFPYQDLRDYYEKWYRPDLQGIIVVGDIDVDRIEGKIKEMFSDIKMPENPAKREYYPVPDNEETIFAIGKDKEQTMALVEIMFKSDVRPDSLKGTVDYLVELYALNLIEHMLNARLSDMVTKPDAPFAVAQAAAGDYMSAKTKDALTFVSVAKGDDLMPAFESIYREALRAKRGGFTHTEFNRAKDELRSQLEKAYNNRNSTPSTSLVEEYVRHFLDNEPIPGIENEYQLMTMLSSQIPLEAINQVFPQMMPENNIVVLAMLPDNGKFVVPTEAQLAEAMKRVEAEDIEAYKEEVKTEPLIANLLPAGKIVSVAPFDRFGAEVWTLSNGAKVVVKKTDFRDDEILFDAQAAGGTSGLSDADNDNLRYLGDAVAMPSFGTYSYSDIQKYLAGKNVSVEYEIDDYTRELSGSAVKKDLPVLMELIYAAFTEFDLNADEFKANQNLYTGILQNRESDPQYQFTKQLIGNLYESPRRAPLDVAVVNNANRERIIEITKDCFSNAGEFVFYFVGNVDTDSLKPLVEKYIASLPGTPVEPAKIELNPALMLKSGSATTQVKQKMDNPQTYAAVILSGNMPFDSKNAKLSSIAGQILSARLIKIVREEEGAVYSISANGSMSLINEPNSIIQTVFPMKPEMKDKVLAIIAGQIEDMGSNISDEELNKVKEYMVKDANENMKKNGRWLNAMSSYQLRQVDTLNGAVDVINSITPDDVKKFMKELSKQNNYRVFVMEAE